MAAPTSPTLSSICSEALSSAGYSNPDSALTTRAQNQWMEEIKNDIYSIEKRLKSLYTTGYSVTVIGRSRYANPSDFGEDLDITLLDGPNTGFCQSGAAGTVTLSVSSTLTSDYLIGKYVLMTSGTSVNNCSQIISYNESTKVASVYPNFITAPVGGDGYLIVENYYDLRPISVRELDNVVSPTSRTRPYYFASVGNQQFGEFVLYRIPDAVYGLQLRYYANLMTLDLAGTLMSTLYQKWRNIFTQGVYARALRNNDDTRADKTMQDYYDMIAILVKNEKDNDNFKAGDTVEPAYR